MLGRAGLSHFRFDTDGNGSEFSSEDSFESEQTEGKDILEEKPFEPDVSASGKITTETPPSEAASNPTPQPPNDTPKTSSPTSAESSSPPMPLESVAPVYTQKDFDEIIAVIRKYAESQTGLKFIWNPVLKMNVFCGWHDTPNLNKRGKDGVIRTLKYNVDLTVDVLTNPANGLTSDEVHFNIIWFEEKRSFFEEPGFDTYFVLLYG